MTDGASPDDERFIERLRARDESAFAELVARYRNRVYGLSYRMMGHREEAEDVAQEVFVSLFKAIDGFRGESRLDTWILRITANHCRNRIKYLSRRHARSRQPLEDTEEGRLVEAAGASHPRPDQQAEGNELETIIRAGLLELDEEHRVVIVLRDMDHLSYQAISEVLEVAEGTVKSRLFRARAQLKSFIQSRYADRRRS
ncbi:MAG: sigma-70 family RNA polymerase sigma factor [Deltaproteobacteria bacterium]|nr:MAG: sigma-70 family RNA polymerase sigma factor [Deltaproteobacteria bacterium]